MSDEVVRQVLQMYGHTPVRLLGIQKGYRNSSHHIVTASGEHLNLIVYKSEPGILERIQQANRAADYAAEHRALVRRTADPRILQLRGGGRTRYAALYTYLPGKTIPWESYTQEHLKLLGKTMSDLHAILASFPAQRLTLITDEYTAILKRIERYFNDKQVYTAIRQKLGVAVPITTAREHQKLMRVCRGLAGQQVLHMDFVRGNILFAEDSGKLGVSGVLDFEKIAYGHPLFDIGRTLAFLLVDCKYKQEHKIKKYFLQSGYNKRGAQQIRDITVHDILEDDISILERLIDLFLLYDFYKFLRHNPYEFLCQNEHYERTKQILINRNIIRAV